MRTRLNLGTAGPASLVGEKTCIAAPAVSSWADRAFIRKLSAAKWF
jgi:hypothetical protein